MKSTFTETITIEFTKPEWSEFLLYLGYTLGCIESEGDFLGLRVNFLRFLNKINEGNPEFTPYKITSEGPLEKDYEDQKK